MPRIGRVVVVGLPHHITQRGNYKQNVFSDDNDRQRYLSWIGEYSSKYHLSIVAYCLMQNHVHFIAIPRKEDSLAKTFNVAHMRYSQYFNKKLKQSGHLWQGRFYSCVLDESHLVLAIRYIERNPVRALMVKQAWQWEWSSALFHSGISKSLLPLSDFSEIVDMSCKSWNTYIDSSEDEEKLDNIRKRTLTGRPLGSATFIERLEKGFGKKLRDAPKGRPKRA